MVNECAHGGGKRISNRDVQRVVKFLAALPDNRKIFKVTWAMIAEYAGLSRQSLQANAEIKKAYHLAKQAFVARSNSRLRKRSSNKGCQDLINENVALQARIAELEKRDSFWRVRWYTIAYNVRQHGLQMERIDRVVPFTGEAMKQQEIQKILDDWNEPIPPVSS
ncbi:hypothetical protein HNE05_00295 [Aquipseudomonas campi]|uniref:Uncharacterized protein n=1 Tax=Aquipseudomonas campi TaxID=2731681 RepID=A0A6M8FCN6_9GAMM|nr:hypothetical protein [Pseudomonas campi]QKE61872.1 hypothetical protein HNE05_00295 [Pseudomonas campi]